MPKATITRQQFLEDRQGKTFADVLNDANCPFDKVIEFFQDENRLRRMEESELHHDRAPLAGVVRELESLPDINQFLGQAQIRRNTRFRQSIGVIVRIIMEQRGWKKTGRKGSLGVRAVPTQGSAAHNKGGLAFWFVRAERYERQDGTTFVPVRARRQEFASAGGAQPGKNGKRTSRG